jgi:hypothetical protein
MNKDLQTETINDLKRRKKIFRRFTQSLSPTDKIQQLVVLQEHYYELLEIREAGGGRKIPENWKKWRAARRNKPMKMD